MKDNIKLLLALIVGFVLGIVIYSFVFTQRIQTIEKHVKQLQFENIIKFDKTRIR
jgi:uncharacterized integral membrane protein